MRQIKGILFANNCQSSSHSMFNIFFQSLEAVRTNLVRAGVTMFIIALGITSLVGVLTSIDGVKYWLSNSFSSLGTNTFRILNSASGARRGGAGSQKVKAPPITFDQALNFKEKYGDKAIVSITGSGNFAGVVKHGNQKTNPNIQIIGTDENYLKVFRYDIDEGRNFSDDELLGGAKVVVIGYEIKKTLFPYGSPIGEKINVDNHIYKVIGVLAEIGTSGSMGGDKIVLIPLETVRADFPSQGSTGRSFSINIFTNRPEVMDYLMEEAKGIFRLIRKLSLGENDNFEIARSDSFVTELMDNLRLLTVSATLIAIITLFGASIALLNVMLVSVTDRTKEIGIRKALGATRQNILFQFLWEAIIICQIGGIIGILLGMGAGNVVSTVLMKSAFIIPWAWIGLGLLLCFIVGIISGIYPAWKAASVDPIDSLRYE